jgi:uncharacterized protein
MLQMAQDLHQSPARNWKRHDSDFWSGGLRCSAWLYLPAGIERPPVVVMGSLLGAEKTFKLPEFAERFVSNGMAVFLFDYRNFGGSDGKPRNLVDPWRHLQDWRAAVAHVREMPNIDKDKLALWGASFAGGHVIQIASEDDKIGAIVAVVPAVDGLASVLSLRPHDLLIGALSGLLDIISTLIFRRPFRVPIVAEPEQFALMNTPESEPGYFALVDKGSSWKNDCPARICLQIPFYRPILSAGRVRCPALIFAANQDSLAPFAATEKVAAKIKGAELITLDCGHFDVFSGQLFEKAIERMTNFLRVSLIEDG